MAIANKQMSKTRMEIIRLLTDHDQMGLHMIADITGRHIKYIRKIMKEFEKGGYVARLDYDMWTATKGK